MESRATRKSSTGEVARCGQPTPTVVILDCGHEARLILLPANTNLTTGSRFRCDGTTWVITGSRPHSRAVVAEPAEH